MSGHIKEEGFWLSLQFGVVTLKNPLRLGLPEAGLCLPSDWGSLRQGCVSPHTGAP